MDIKNTTSPNFVGFKKIVGTPNQIARIRQDIPDKYLTLAVKKKPLHYIYFQGNILIS